jgi:hypothetical protein
MSAAMRDQGIAPLLGLLRMGEQSAEQAFGRISAKLSRTQFAHAVPALQTIAADEARHDRLLAAAASVVDADCCHPRSHMRRFFMRLESRDPATHLARIASLDGAVCQVLSSLLATTTRSTFPSLPYPIAATLATIRADEGRHVRVARTLANELGLDSADLRAIDLDTRHRFADTLLLFEDSLVMLGIDWMTLRTRIRRDAE